eukprot:TRINITY_DN89816_c0_g1_i1.p1 TRINITY_DN89816_c0_g1~~TRINITY_DN89816_c0_g1_i1.p1  ORF type:complete len:1171 (+),score=260.54 TRINITY_DN89816_c0_g1_i1:49-3513(+)
MVKTRFSSVDVRAMVNSIRPSAVGCKLTNIYDINSKVYLLKLQRRGFKCFLLLESGSRFHLTQYSRDKSSVPSNYTMKLRKHLRNRRLTSINQLGADRIVDFQFGHGDSSFHLLLEIYVSGNLILTDQEYNILTLLRTHSDHETKVAMRQVYPLEKAMGLLKCPITDFPTAIEEIIDTAAARAENQEIAEIENDEEKDLKGKKKGVESAFTKRSKKRVSHSAMPLVMILHKLAPFADPVLCASCIAKVSEAAGRPLNNAFKFTIDDLALDEAIELLQGAAELLLETLRSVSRPDDLGGGSMPELSQPAEGIDVEDGEEEDEDEDAPVTNGASPETPSAECGISSEAAVLAQKGPPPEALAPVVPGWIVRKQVHAPPSEPTWTNEEFTALSPAPASAEADALLSFASFHRCVDEFFIQLEEHKAVEQKAQHAQSVMARVERIRADQGRRLEQLVSEQEASERKARLIERNIEFVDRALAMLNTMIASQVDWGELWREVKRQQRLGHPIAEHIHSLNLEQNEFKILLPDIDEDEEEDDKDGNEDRPMEVVPLDLNLTSHANIARLHSRRKETRDKTARTATHAEAAIKSAERKAQQDLNKYELKQSIRRVRPAWWFEKFIWFVSSENYLVVAGHDALQTEQLFLKHIGPDDAFVQADVAGARTCFVRNPEGGEVPPATIREAGTLTLCHSSAWDKQIVISAWSVPVKQVTRGKPPEGDYHPVDGFFVVGQRHFMPPLHLEMGMTLLFQVSEESGSERHKGERRSRYLEAMAACQEAVPAAPLPAADAEKVEDKEPLESDSSVQDEDINADNDEKVDGGAHDEDETPKETDEAEDEIAEPPEVRDPGSKSKVCVSKAEQHRRGKTNADDDASAETHFDPPQRSPSAREGREAEPETQKTKGPAPLPRGQRSKAKKMKKYADQDDDERELRMALLGSKNTKRNADSAGRSPPSRGAAEIHGHADAPQQENDDVGVSPSASATKGAGNAKGSSSGQASERPPGPRRPPPAKDLEFLRAGCQAEANSTNALQLRRLDLLTGQPQPEDEVLYAMAMVAPYCSLGGPYMLRVKLTPGNLKKGQAVRHCLKIFEEQLDRRNWKQLVQAVPENEGTSMMCGSCKLSMPGLQKLQALMRKEKKKESPDSGKQQQGQQPKQKFPKK